MLLFQTLVPAFLVICIFIAGHFFVSSSGSGLYISDFKIEPEEPLELTEEVNPIDIDPDTGLLLPDKYNYLKIELKTHDINGISDKDFKLAKTIDDLKL